MAPPGPLRSTPDLVTALVMHSSAPTATSRALPENDGRLRGELSADLQRTQGNVSEVARTMGKARMQIHRRMKRFGIAPRVVRP